MPGSNLIDLSAALRDQLVANDAESKRIDPATVPLRFSTLKLIQQSPLHYWHAVQRGYDETLSMRLGSGAHAILFGTPYVVWSGRRAGKDWDAFAKKHEGELVLTTSEYEKAQDMARAIRSNPIASRLLFTDTKLETRIDWEWQGRSFRSTPDAASRTTLVDLKCLRSAEPDKVMWQSRNMYYNAQAALYRMALNSIGHNIKDCFLVVVENKPPYPTTVFRFLETALEAGERSLQSWMERLRECESSGSYPGYATTIQDLGVPVSMDDLQFDDDEEEESGNGL
jgi:hypothetical protein